MAKILVADDEIDLAEIWKEALEEAGHSVVLTHTGLQTVAMLQEEEFDLLITDINMPDGGGVYATSEARNLDSKIPVIAVSGNPGVIGSGMLARLPKLGADQILIKPIDLDELVEVANRTLEIGPRLGIAELVKSLFAKQEEK